MNSEHRKSQLTRKRIGDSRFGVPSRLQDIELLDQGVGTMDDVRQNLNEMWVTNKLLGGVRAVTRRLYSRLSKNATQTTVVELGTGSGKLGRELSDWAEQHQRDLRLILIDISARHLQIASENVGDESTVGLIQADALTLPFAHHQIDYCVSSLLLHHFEPEDLIKLLSDLYQTYKCTIIMGDLIRSRLSLIGFRLIQPLFARHYLTKHDGLLSIRRAYIPTELLDLAHNAGIENARVYRDYPWYMTLVAEQPDV